jgi:murein L,D-transpeptidase YcbB/YkuD
MRKALKTTIICFLAAVVNSAARQPERSLTNEKLLNPGLVNRFYALKNQHIVWFSDSRNVPPVHQRLISLLDSCYLLGLDKTKYHYSELIIPFRAVDSLSVNRRDRLYTDAVLSFAMDVYTGADIKRWIMNDETSASYAGADQSYIINGCLNITSEAGLEKFMQSLEPVKPDYQLLKRELAKMHNSSNKKVINELVACLNLYRWIFHNPAEKYIVVNIPALTLKYYEQEAVRLESRVVVGKVATRSPRFSSWCYQVVLYPYWNVPPKIGLRELLPRFKRSPESMDKMNIQLVNRNDKVVSRNAVNWSQVTASNFPYRFRQCTGCDNSLGVIKFNLSDPFDVYLHDTNFKLAFLKDARFLSHGCIRVEKPIELANFLVDNTLDSNFLKACYKDQLPRPMNLNKKVPVYVVYMPAEARGDSVYCYKDVYKLFK